MKFPKLIIENFLSIEKAEVNLADRGLVVINGVNEINTSAKSNGAGKSSIPDALYWCISGKTARGLSGDAVVRRDAGKNTMVQATCQDALECYIVRRYRKHKTGKNSLQLFQMDPLTSGEIDLTKGTEKLTQDAIWKIMGCSEEVFLAAGYAAQERMPDLPGMTDKQLKMLVEEAAGVTVLEEAYKEAATRLGAAKSASAITQNDLVSANIALEFQQNTLKQNQDRFTQYEVDIRTQLDVMIGEAKKLGDQAKSVAEEIGLAEKPVVLAQIEGLNKQIMGSADERMRESTLNKVANNAVMAHTTAVQTLTRLSTGLGNLKAGLAGIDKIVGTSCGECNKVYCEHDIGDARKKTEEVIAAKKIDVAEAQATVVDAAAIVTSEQAKLSAFQATMTDISATTASLASYNDVLKAITVLEGQQAQHIKLAREKMTQITHARAKTNPFAIAINDSKAQIDLCENKQKEVIAQVVLKVAAVARSEIVLKVFSPAGVRAHILDTVTPYLNDQTAKYLGALTDGNTTANWTTIVKTAKGELREKFSIEVADLVGGDSFAGLSGGEKRKVRIATSLALQDLVARRAGKPLELFIGDEIDDALDDSGLERLAGILMEKSKECGSVFVISHNDMSDWVSNSITVTKGADNKSVVTEERI